MAGSRRAVLLHAALLLSLQVSVLAVSESDQRIALVDFLKSIDAVGVIQQYDQPPCEAILDDSIQCTCDSNNLIEFLSIKDKQFQGQLPDDPSIYEALGESLTYLELSNLGLGGTIPTGFAELAKSLETLKLNKNYLNGTLPDLGNMPRLKTLDLSDNSLQGTVPRSYTAESLPALEELKLEDNPRFCASRAQPKSTTTSRSAAQRSCPLRVDMPQGCDCAWASASSYACSIATASCQSANDDVCKAVRDQNAGALARLCEPIPPSPRPSPKAKTPAPAPAPEPEPAPEPAPKRVASSPAPAPAAKGATGAAASATTGAAQQKEEKGQPGHAQIIRENAATATDPTFAANSANGTEMEAACTACLGSFNNSICRAAVARANPTASAWLTATLAPASPNATDSAAAFAGWLKEACTTKLDSSPSICTCKDSWRSSYCSGAQLEQCIGRNDLCFDIINAPVTLNYAPIIGVYTNSCSLNQTTLIAGVQVTLYLINRTLVEWSAYKQGVRASLAAVTGANIDNVQELTAVELPSNSSAAPVVQAVLFLVTANSDTTYTSVLDAFKTNKFTEALRAQNVPLQGADLYASVEMKAPAPAPPGKGGVQPMDVEWWLIVIICLAALILIALIVLGVFLWRRNSKKKQQEDLWGGMKFPPAPSVHNSQYSPKPSRSVRLDMPGGMAPRPGSAAPSPTMRSAYGGMAENPYGDAPMMAGGGPIYAGSPYTQAGRYDTPSSAASGAHLLRNMGSQAHTPGQPASPSMTPMNRDDAQAERAKFWAQFQLSWERQKARQAAGTNIPRVGATFEDDDDIPSSGTSWTSQSDAKHAFRRY